MAELAPFAALEQQAIADVYAHLANATALVEGVLVAGIFRNDYTEVFGGAVAGSQPVFECAESALPPDLERGAEVVLRDVEYVVAEIQPDGGGNVLLRLRLA